MKSILIVHGLSRNELLLGEFLRSCFAQEAPDFALSAFRSIQNPSLKLQNLMLKGLNRVGFYEELLIVYIKCRTLGCSSDCLAFSLAIKASAKLGIFEIGKEIHSIALRSGYGGNVVTQTALVDFYAKNGYLRNARQVIDKIPEPDLVSWNALLSGYSLNGCDHEALEIFRKIQVMGLKPNTSTFASVIPVCTRLGCVVIGKPLHGLAVKSGCFSDGFLVPALISMYGSDADLSAARAMFESLVERNVVVWNAMINAYTQNKRFYDASEMFREMLRASVTPDSVTFVSIIPSSESYSSIGYGESLHAYVVKLGIGNQVSVLTALVSMYSRHGDVYSSKCIFDEMPRTNLLSWNAMISGYVSNDLCDESLVAVRAMQLAGYAPDDASVVSILSACSRVEDILLGKSTHAFIVRREMEASLNVSNALLAFYSYCYQLSSSFKLFNRMAAKNVVSWNTMISSCIHNEQVDNVATLVHLMQLEGINLDLVTVISILPSCSSCENHRLGMTLHGYAIKAGFESDCSLGNALITMYCDCGDLDSGRLLFENMPERSLVSWNSLMTGYRHNNLPDKVLVLFAQMLDEGQRPNHITLLNLLPVCRSQLQGKSIHAFAVRTGTAEATTTLSSLIFMYARFGNLKSSESLFQLAQKGDISSWNAIMSVNTPKRAVSCFLDLLQLGLEPDNITVMSLISASAELKTLDLIDSAMAFITRKGFGNDLNISNALVDAYARCGELLISEKLFENLLEKDAVSWNAMINGYRLHGETESALEFYSRMQLSTVKPDSSTYTSVLSACSHAGLVNQGLTVLNSVIENKIPPRLEHYACIVDLLGRTGKLGEAYAIVKRSPFEPSIGMLKSLLGACRVHSNVELGEKIAEMLMEIDSGNPEPYVMLHNIYADAGKWNEANLVRNNMERKQVKKNPGFSLLVQDEHDS